MDYPKFLVIGAIAASILLTIVPLILAGNYNTNLVNIIRMDGSAYPKGILRLVLIFLVDPKYSKCRVSKEEFNTFHKVTSIGLYVSAMTYFIFTITIFMIKISGMSGVGIFVCLILIPLLYCLLINLAHSFSNGDINYLSNADEDVFNDTSVFYQFKKICWGLFRMYSIIVVFAFIIIAVSVFIYNRLMPAGVLI